MGKFFAKGVDQLVWSKPVIVILSILFSLFIWLFAVDPVKTITFSIPIKTVALEPDNTIKSKGLIVLNQDIPNTTEITMIGRTSYLDALKMDKFYSTLDFTKINSNGKKSLTVDGPFGGDLSGIKIIEMTQKQVEVQVDKLSDSMVLVDMRLSGVPKAGYKIISKSIVPESIQLIGSDALIKRASKGVVDVDVLNIDVGFKETVYIKIIDKNGIEVKGTEKKYKTLVNIEVAKEVKVVPVLQGVPTNGFTYVNGTAKVLPKMVLLKGSKEQLNGILQIYTMPINTSGLTQDTIMDAQLDIPKGITVYGINSYVKVSIPIQGTISRQIEIPSSLLKFTNKNPIYKYSNSSLSIIFRINGSSNVVNKIDELSLKPTLDVKGLALGQHLLSFNAPLPPHCTFDGKHEVLINVEKINN